MTNFLNDFNSGTDGVAVDVANSAASGDAFTSVTGGGGAPLYTNISPIEGALDAEFGTSTPVIISWDDGVASADFSLLMLFYLPGIPTTSGGGLQVLNVRTLAGVDGSVAITSSGQITPTAGTTTQTAAGGAIPGAGAYWLRAQGSGYGTGSATFDTQTYDDATRTLIRSTTQTGVTTTSAAQRWRFGRLSGASGDLATGFRISYLDLRTGTSTPIALPTAPVVAVTGLASLGGGAYTLVAKSTPSAAVSSAGVVDLATLRKATPAVARAAAGLTPLDIARKNATPTGRALAGVVARDTAAKAGRATGTAAAGVAPVSTVRKASAAAGRALAGVTAVGTLSAAGARAVVARLAAGVAGTATGRKVTPAAARGALGLAAVDTVRKSSPAAGRAPAGPTARAVVRRALVGVGRAAAGVTTRAALGKATAVAGRALAGITGRATVGVPETPESPAGILTATDRAGSMVGGESGATMTMTATGSTLTGGS